MVLLSVAIVIALLVTIGLPIAAGIWLNKHAQVPWRVITYGALGYFVVQALMTFVLIGFTALVENSTPSFSERAFFIAQLALSILIGALLGVIIRWAGMKYLKEPLVSLEAAFGIGVGYGGIESIVRVGLPLMMTFFSMVSNLNIDPQTTTLEPEILTQLEALWQVQAYVPLVGSLERVAALVMHITVTLLILQAFTQKNNLWLGAAVGLEVLINGLIVGLAEAGLPYGWVILLSLVLMAGNIYLLSRLNGINIFSQQADDDHVI